MWKTRDSLGDKWIEEVEVERITVSSVWVKGRRNAIRSTWEAYHVTWEVAHAYILGIAMSELDSAQHRLDRARCKLEKVKAMKPNAPLERSEQSGDTVSAETVARETWNSEADEHNQWDSLGQDEKDELIANKEVGCDE